VYRRTDEIEKLAKELTGKIKDAPLDLDQLDQALGADDAPIAKLLRSIFEDAVQVNASDIHIEPAKKAIRLRFRVDGLLQEHLLPDAQVASLMTQRLKILAKLNITEHRLPQDGHFSLRIKQRNFDIRLSTLPTEYGESVVMRLLDQAAKVLHIPELGLAKPDETSIRSMLLAPHGMIIVTGPTGSGKTTTLFSLLNELNTAATKIITIEDPIEYHLPRLNQVLVNSQIGLSFASVLRSALRQDPDVLMVGEIRDSETLSIALRAAITGHLVLATLHTNDALSSVIRMLDLGAENFLIASALRLVLAQRLVRQLCANCSIEYAPNAIEQLWLDKMQVKGPYPFKIGKGCQFCNHTGFQGRFALFEVLPFNDELSQCLRQNQLAELSTLANRRITPLWQAGLEAALAGKTALSEVIYLDLFPEN
jgi:MSHA biogenesis protein MshE